MQFCIVVSKLQWEDPGQKPFFDEQGINDEKNKVYKEKIGKIILIWIGFCHGASDLGTYQHVALANMDRCVTRFDESFIVFSNSGTMHSQPF